MGSINRVIVAVFVFFLVLSNLIVLTATPVSAQAGYKPSVPQFTVKLVDNSYDVPPSTTTVTDPYTGETKSLNAGGYVSDKTIEVIIKSQPFTAYTNASGHEMNLYYIIEVKGHFSEYWGHLGYPFFYKQYDSEDIVVKKPANNYEDGSQLEFRVKAVVAYDASYYDYMAFQRSQYWLDEHATSDYSSIKTLKISYASPSQSATFPPVNSEGNSQPQYPGQTQPPNRGIFTNPLFTLVIGVLIGSVVIAVVLVVLRRHVKTPTYTNDTPQTNALQNFYHPHKR
jgi:hypothetical protein